MNRKFVEYGISWRRQKKTKTKLSKSKYTLSTIKKKMISKKTHQLTTCCQSNDLILAEQFDWDISEWFENEWENYVWDDEYETHYMILTRKQAYTNFMDHYSLYSIFRHTH